MNLREFIRTHWIGIGVGSIGWIATIPYFIYEHIEYGAGTWSHLLTLESLFILAWIPGFMVAGYLYDRKLTSERMARLREERYRTLVETAKDGLVSIDPSGKFLFLNEQFCRMTGYSKNELLAMNWAEMLPEENKENVAHLKMALTENLPLHIYEGKMVKKDGRLIDVQARWGCLHSEDTVVGALGVIRDVTEHRNYETELRNLKNFTDSVLNGISDAVSVIDVKDYKVVSANKAFLNILGMSMEEVVGKPCYELTHKRSSPCEPPNYPCPMKELLSTEKPATMEHVHLGKGNEESFVEVTAYPIYENGIQHIVHIARDITERKKLEIALKEHSEHLEARVVERTKEIAETRDYLQRLIDGTADAVLTVDLEGKVTSWNSGAEKIYGYAAKEVLGKELPIVPPNQKENFKEIWKKIKKKETIPDHETVRMRKDRSLVEVSTTISPVLDSEGNVIGMSGIQRDISKRKELEHRLMEYSGQLEHKVEERTREITETKDYLQKLIDTSPLSIITTDMDGKITSANKKTEEMYGYKADELISKHARTLQPKKVPENYSEMYKIVTTDGVKGGELLNVRKNGEVFPVHVHFTSILDAAGEPVGMISIAEDITEQRRMEDALRDSKERYRALIETAKDGLISVDAGGGILFVNDGYSEITGYAKDDLLAMNWSDVVPEEERKEALELFELALSEDLPLHIYEGKMVRKDGCLIDVQVRWACLHAEGKVVGAMGVVRDVTEHRKAQEALKYYSKQLEESNKLKDLFTDIMRHDLLNPLGVIKGVAQLMATMEEFTDKREVEVIQRNAFKVEQLIESSSKFARISSLKDIQYEDLDLDLVLREVIRNMQPLAREKGMKIKYAPKRESVVKANHIIEDVFVNLVSNAIKYSPEKTQIDIGIKNGAAGYRVYVKDHGPGIPDEYKETVFERFIRADKRGVKGTGLGLAIVKRVVELHNGKVWVEDNPGGGSVFNVTIPKEAM